VLGWDYSGLGLATPPELSGKKAIAIAAGGSHDLAITEDGTIVAWGSNTSGEGMAPGALSGVVAIAAGAYHSLAIRQDETVAAWGSDTSGQTDVPNDLGGVIGVAAGFAHSLALQQDGAVVAWGAGGPGQSGADNYGQSVVPSGLGGVIAVAAGWWHSLALRQDGTVVAWGDNTYGQRVVPQGLRGVVAVAAGGVHSLALQQSGNVVAWGSFYDGQNYAGMTVPADVSRGEVVAIAAGDNHSVALLQDGTVVTWGNVTGSTNVVRMPPDLSGNTVTAIAAGGDHDLALRQDGTVVAWGDNLYRESTMPLALSGITAVAVAGASQYSMALLCPQPLITASPLTQTAEAGSAAGLDVVAGGVPPLTYQWVWGSTNVLVGATNSFLVLTNPQFLQSGDAYTVIVTNAWGAVTSETAALSIIPPVPRRTVPMLHLTGDVGSLLHLDYADALARSPAWQALDALTLINPPQHYLDLTDPVRPNRFYRAWQTNVPHAWPAINVGMATEIPLAGPIGSSVRIDYINQFGPTNGWVTLDTALLTNSPQLYFDTTAFRRPARLYRLVPVP
jgi:hypothetical protein